MKEQSKTGPKRWKYKKTFFVSIGAYILLFYNTYCVHGINALKSNGSFFWGSVVWVGVFFVVWRFFVAMAIIMTDKRTSANCGELNQVNQFHHENDLFKLSTIERLKKSRKEKENKKQ